MESRIRQDGSREVYLEAGFYLLSPDAQIVRIEAPENQHNAGGQYEHRLEPFEEEEDEQIPAVIKYEYPSPTMHPTLPLGYAATWDVGGGGRDFEENDGGNEEPDEGHHPSTASLLLPAMAPKLPTADLRNIKYVAQGLLPDQLMGQIVNEAYDTLWMRRYGVDQMVDSAYKSRLKLEELFGHGVFEVGDVFKIVGGRQDVEAIVVSWPLRTAHNAYPDFTIHNTITGTTIDLVGCNGVSDLYHAMNDQQQLKAWKQFADFEVFRHGANLGNLARLRMQLEVWIEEKDLYDRRMGGAGRRRRAPNVNSRNAAAPAGNRAQPALLPLHPTLTAMPTGTRAPAPRPTIKKRDFGHIS